MKAIPLVCCRVATAIAVTTLSVTMLAQPIADGGNASSPKTPTDTTVAKPKIAPKKIRVAQAPKPESVRKVQLTGSHIPHELRGDKPLWTMSPVSVVDSQAIARSGRATLVGVLTSQVPGVWGR